MAPQRACTAVRREGSLRVAGFGSLRGFATLSGFGSLRGVATLGGFRIRREFVTHSVPARRAVLPLEDVVALEDLGTRGELRYP